jgi:tetratricopeptide (TPR) repeat protein
MSSTTREEQLSKLAKAAYEKRLIIFVGAGLSCKLKNISSYNLGNWWNFVEKLLVNLKCKGFRTWRLQCLIDANRHKLESQKYEPIDILRLLEGIKYPKDAEEQIKKFSKDFFSLHKEQNDDSAYVLHKKIFKLTNKAITTNYDEAFENAKIESLNIAFEGKKDELREMFEDKQMYKGKHERHLLKLHGCVSKPETMVILPAKYDKLYNREKDDTEPAIFILQNLIVNNTILFIGCGMGDFQINSIFANIKNMLDKFTETEHFIIMKENEINDKLPKFLSQIVINNYPEIENILEGIMKEKERLEKEKFGTQSAEQSSNDENVRSSRKFAENGKAYYIYKDYENAIDSCRAATVLDPNNAFAFNLWGIALYELAKLQKDESTYKDSINKYEEAINLDSRYTLAFYNWGLSLSGLAKLKNDKDLYVEAIDKYKKATELEPKYVQAFSNWGVALYNLAKLKNDKDLYVKAIDKCKKAIELDPDCIQAFYNWGAILEELAKLKNDKDLYVKAIDKYKKTIELDPNDASAFNGYANALSGLAKLKNDKNSFYGAIKLYIKAIKLDPDCIQAFYNWGLALYNLAKLANKEDLYYEALEKYKEAEKLFPGNAYIIACIYALLDDKKNAMYYLEKSLANKEMSMEHILNDEDWKAYLDDKEFQALIDKYR